MDMPFMFKLIVVLIILLAECAWLLKLIKKIGQGLGFLKPDTPPVQAHHYHHYSNFDEEIYKMRLKAQYEDELRQRRQSFAAESSKSQQWRDVSPGNPRLSSPIKLLPTKRH